MLHKGQEKIQKQEERMPHEGEKICEQKERDNSHKIWGMPQEGYFNNIQYPCGTTLHFIWNNHMQKGKAHQTM